MEKHRKLLPWIVVSVIIKVKIITKRRSRGGQDREVLAAPHGQRRPRTP